MSFIPGGTSSMPDPKLLKKIERVKDARRHKYNLREKHITMSHGSGGKATHNLIEGLFVPAFSNALLNRMDDAAAFTLLEGPVKLAFTTDSYVVQPLFFPGGDIGKLAIHGTINDLAMAGAQPLYLSASFILEEGFSIDELQRIVSSMKRASEDAGIAIVTGDTKVVPRGKGDGVFINTAGIGIVKAVSQVAQNQLMPGDKVIISGTVGDHGMAVLLAREMLEIEADIQSDTAPLHTLVAAMLDVAGEGLHALKDPTRGGVATSLNEMAIVSEVAIILDERTIPVRPAVRGVCEILGLDPLTIANEGKLLAIVEPKYVEPIIKVMRTHPLGKEATVIGTVEADPSSTVFLRTDIGGKRVLDMLVGDPLPRIC